MSTQDPDLLKDAARVQGGKDDLFFLHQRREQLEAEIAAEKAGPDDLDRKIADARNRLEQLQAADPPQFQGFQADTGFPGTTELAGPMPAGGQGLPPEPGLGSAADRGMTEEEFFDSNPLQGLEQPEGVTAPDALAYLGLRARSGLESLARPAFRLFNSLSRLVEGGALRAGQAADWVVEQATGPGMSDFTGMAESMQRGDLEPEHITRLLERPQTKEAQAGVEQRVEKAFPALKRIKRWVDMGAETIGWVLGPPGQMVGAVAGRTQAALQGAGMSAALAHPAGFATGIFTERLAESQDPVEALRATAHVPMYLVAGFGGAKFAKLASKVMPQRLAIAAGGMAEGLAFTGLNTDTIQHGVRILGERTRLAAKLEAAMAAGEDTTAIAADIEQLDQEWEGVIDEAISGAWAFGVMKGAMAKVPRETKEVRDGLRKKDAIERPKDREAKVEGARPAEEATPRPEVAPPDLSRQPMRVLREQAKEAGLTGTSKLRKDELILQLEMHKRGVEQKAKAQEEAIAREPVIDPKAPPPATPEAGFARLTGETGATAELGMAAKGILPELDRKLSRGINWMERRLGTPGKRLAKAARIVTQKSGARQGKNIQEVRKVLDKTFGVDSRKLGGEQLVDLTDAMKFVNGYRDAGEISPRARKLAEDLRASADKSRDEWIKLEGETRVGNKWVPTTKTGEYFPQVPNKVGIKKLQAIVKKPNGKAAHAAAQFMVDRGLAKDVPAALRKVEQYLRDHVTTNNPNLQRTRVKLPEEWIEWDPRKVLPRVLEKNWISVEAWREWGKRLNSLDSTVAEISSANEAAGRRVKDFFDAEVGFKPPQDVSPGSKEFRSLVGNYLTASKLSSPLSTIRNAMQLLPNTALLHPQHVAMAFIKYPPIARMWLKASREIEMEMERAGAVRSRTQLADIEQGSLSSRLAGTVLKPFTSQEKANQVRAAFAAKLQMEADAKILMKHAKYGPRLLERLHVIARILGSDKASLERRAKKLGITDAELIEVAKTGKFTNDQLEMASFRMMQDTQFALTMASRRLWETRHPWAKIMFKFKAFGLDQLGMMRDHVVAEARRGNMRPAVQFTLGSALAGTIYLSARDLLLGRDESITSDDRKLGHRLLDAIGEGGGLGMLADLSWGIGDYIVGPVGSSTVAAGRAALRILERPATTPVVMERFLRDELPAFRHAQGLTDRIQGQVGKVNNYASQLALWRSRGREWKDEHPGATGVGPATSFLQDVFYGPEKHREGRNTFLLSLAAGQIDVGDVDDASHYVKLLLDEAKEQDVLKAVASSVRQSMRMRSPLGWIARKDRGAFLKQFSEDERKEVRALQRRWLEFYRLAFVKAAK